MSGQRWDAIVVGAGHNGLVAAAYLGRAGLRTLLLERRETVGGAIGTSEVAPSARVPTLAHTVGRLAPGVARELELAKHGLRLVQPAALATSVGGEGPPITLWADPARTAADLRCRLGRRCGGLGVLRCGVPGTRLHALAVVADDAARHEGGQPRRARERPQAGLALPSPGAAPRTRVHEDAAHGHRRLSRGQPRVRRLAGPRWPREPCATRPWGRTTGALRR